MKILAADTGTAINTVAITDGPHVLGEVTIQCGRAHSERLLETVEWLLAETALSLKDLDALAIARGPGSFTGLRIGIATLKGLAMGAGLPLVGVSTLDALAREGALYDGTVCPMVDARMGEVFGAIYRFDGGQRSCLKEAMVGSVEDVMAGLEGPVCCFGDGADAYAERVCATMTHDSARHISGVTPRASHVAAEGQALLERGASGDPAEVTPVYLRKSQAEVNRDRVAAL